MVSFKVGFLLFIPLLASQFLNAQAISSSSTDTSQRRQPVNPVRPLDSVADVSSGSFTLEMVKDAPAVLGVPEGRTNNNKWVLLLPELSLKHPLFNFHGGEAMLKMEKKKDRKDEALFYVLFGLFLFYGFIKVAFTRYHEILFRIFFRTTLQRQQLSEQLLQDPWPSLLLNILFVLAAGLYASFLCRYFGAITQFGVWQLMLYFSSGLALIYSGKYILLRMFGWMLGITSLTNSYIFTVFMVNKVAGIFLLPILLMVSFPFLKNARMLIPVSLVVVLILLFYRFMNSFQQVRKEIRLNVFHFFIYLCGFEIAPLLVSFKVLLLFVEQTY